MGMGMDGVSGFGFRVTWFTFLFLFFFFPFKFSGHGAREEGNLFSISYLFISLNLFMMQIDLRNYEKIQ
ncbi:hypothetical protein DFH27DRAFT_565728 [Peziza echinospora]|nr:hypothetical protein DFH27DRAFT_565728 [Peziza echinospora]